MTLDLLDKFRKRKGPLEAVPMNPKGEYFPTMNLEEKFSALSNLKEYQKKLKVK